MARHKIDAQTTQDTKNDSNDVTTVTPNVIVLYNKDSEYLAEFADRIVKEFLPGNKIPMSDKESRAITNGDIRIFVTKD